MNEDKAKKGLDSPTVKFLDWALSLVALGLGLIWSSYFLIAIGVVGLVCAWLRPASKIVKFVDSLKKKRI